MVKLNDLDAKTWVKLTKSWFLLSGKTRNKMEVKHPAKYPEELAEKFILFFSKSGDTVFDPFMGVGSTGVAAIRNNRKCIGIEINNEFCNIARKRIENEKSLFGEMNNSIITEGDSRDKHNYPKSVDFIITSPPYWDMLKKQRGHSLSQHKIRKEKDLPLYYSDNLLDLGNIEDYDQFMKELSKVFKNCSKILAPNKYMVIVVQNFRNTDGNYITFAWDIAEKVKKYKFSFEGEQIWCQDDKQLGIWGYPSKFITNIHHHYCLVFRKNA